MWKWYLFHSMVQEVADLICKCHQCVSSDSSYLHTFSLNIWAHADTDTNPSQLKVSHVLRELCYAYVNVSSVKTLLVCDGRTTKSRGSDSPRSACHLRWDWREQRWTTVTRYKQEVSQAEVKQQSEEKEAARKCLSERERDSPEGVRGRPMSFNHRTTDWRSSHMVQTDRGTGSFSMVLWCTRCTLIYSNVLWFTLVYFDLVWRTVKYLVHRRLSQTQYLGQNLFNKNCKYIHLDWQLWFLPPSPMSSLIHDRLFLSSLQFLWDHQDCQILLRSHRYWNFLAKRCL